MAGWRDTLRDFGLPADEMHWAEGNWSSASGAQAAERLFHQYTDMDAIFVGNDQMALSVLQVACSRGPHVPEDLGVVGFDDIPESAFFAPPLTTVAQDQYNVAKVAVEEIIKIIESGWQGASMIQSKSIVLAPTLVVRQSSLRQGSRAKEVNPANENREQQKEAPAQ
jgi:DNA-binding LacI/PurR family transcriptional regulator